MGGRQVIYFKKYNNYIVFAGYNGKGLGMSIIKRKRNHNLKNINILYISPLSPSYGGIVSWKENIIKKGLPYAFKKYIVDTRLINRVLFGPTKLNFAEIKRNINILYNL